MMTIRIEEMIGLGPKTAQRLADIGIFTDADLREIGAITAYRRLRFRFGRQVTLNALYGMEAALRGCDWRAFNENTRTELRRQAQGDSDH